MKKNSQYTWW